jgi:hypothetical protein
MAGKDEGSRYEGSNIPSIGNGLRTWDTKIKMYQWHVSILNTVTSVPRMLALETLRTILLSECLRTFHTYIDVRHHGHHPVCSVHPCMQELERIDTSYRICSRPDSHHATVMCRRVRLTVLAIFD